MKIGIYGGEAFPIYSIHLDGFEEIDVPMEKLESWRKVFESFTKVQEEIMEELRKNGKDYWSAHGVWDSYNFPNNSLQVDDLVTHSRFGRGIVLKTSSNPAVCQVGFLLDDVAHDIWVSVSNCIPLR